MDDLLHRRLKRNAKSGMNWKDENSAFADQDVSFRGARYARGRRDSTMAQYFTGCARLTIWSFHERQPLPGRFGLFSRRCS